MAIAWTDLPLTVGQRNAIQSLVVWKNSLSEGEITQPPLTYSQIKALRKWFADLETLIAPARAGGQMAIRYYQERAVSDFDGANP